MRPAVCSFLFFFILRFAFRLVRDSCSSHLLHHNAAHSTNCEPLQTLASSPWPIYTLCAWTILGAASAVGAAAAAALYRNRILLLKCFPWAVSVSNTFCVLVARTSMPGPGTKWRIRNVFIVYTTLQFIANLCRNQSKQPEAARPFATDSLPSLHPLALPFYLSLSLSLNLPLAVLPLSMQIQLTLQRVGSLLSPSPTVKGIQS